MAGITAQQMRMSLAAAPTDMKMGLSGNPQSARTEETLDPQDWGTLKALSHEIVDDSIAYLRDIRDRPSWRSMPAEVKAFFASPLPRNPAGIAGIYRDVTEKLRENLVIQSQRRLGEGFAAEDDAKAIGQAERHSDCVKELWCGGRRVKQWSEGKAA